MPSKSNLALLLSLVAAMLAGASLLVDTPVLGPQSSASANLQAQMRNFILDNPQVLFDAIQRHEEAQRAAEDDAIKAALIEHRKELLNSPSPVAGNPNGDVTIIEFFDYNCPYCRKAVPVINEAIKADNELRIVFK